MMTMLPDPRRGVICSISFLVLAAITCSAVAEPKSILRLPVVAVMDFVDRSTEDNREAWVGDALVEMMTSDLSESRHLTVIDRTYLVEHYKEMNLAEVGLVTSDSAARFGRIARASHVVFGSYAIEGESIVVNVGVIDLATSQMTRKASVEGALATVLALSDDLTIKVLEAMHVVPSDTELASILANQTVSIDAAEAYYLGRLALHAQELETALGHMLAAASRDVRFAEPHAAIIDIYRALGDEARARTVRADFYKRFPRHRLVFGELYSEAEQLRAEGRTAAALEIYKDIVKQSLDIYAAGAWVRLAVMQPGSKLERIERYRNALRIRPDIGSFKLEAVKGLQALGALKGDVALRMCSAPVEEVRLTAYEAVIRGGYREAIEQLYDVYLSDRYHFSGDRSCICKHLLDYGEADDWLFLIEAVKDGYSTFGGGVRMCSRFVELRYEPFLDVVSPVLETMLPKEQSWAVSVLSRWHHPSIAAAVRRLLQPKTDHRVLIAACESVAKLKDQQAIPLLMQLLDHDYYQRQTRTYEVRQAAYSALMVLGAKVQKPLLQGDGMNAPTISGTAAEQGVWKSAFPSITALASQQNADGKSWSDQGKGYGYIPGLKLLNALLGAGGYRGGIHYNPWSDRDDGRFQREWKSNLKQGLPVLSAASVEDLLLADCVVACCAYNLEDQVVSALNAYVKQGGGLLVTCAFNMVNPKKTPEFYEMMGFPQGSGARDWYSVRQETHFTAVSDHPLVQGMPLGVPMAYGKNFWSSLLYSKDILIGTKHRTIMRTDNPECEAVIIREHGKGRIVIVNWSAYTALASHVGPLTCREFLMRCADWAGRMDEKYATPWSGVAEEALSRRQQKWLAAYHIRWRKEWDATLTAKGRIDIAAGSAADKGRSKGATVAVLPFTKLKGNRSLDAVAASMAPVLGTLIETAAGLKQVDREDMDRIFAEHEVSLGSGIDDRTRIKVGGLLGANYLVVSTIRQEADALVLTCRIQDVESTRIVASAEARGSINGIVEMLQSAAADMVGDLQQKQITVQLPDDGTPLANLHYMQGLAYMWGGDPARAIGEFTAACRYAPTHANARASLAKAYEKLEESN